VAKWWLPDDVVFIDAVPKTSVGKFNKRALREQFKDYSLPGNQLTTDRFARHAGERESDESGHVGDGETCAMQVVFGGTPGSIAVGEARKIPSQ